MSKEEFLKKAKRGETVDSKSNILLLFKEEQSKICQKKRDV